MNTIISDNRYGGLDFSLEGGVAEERFALTREHAWDLFEALSHILVDRNDYVQITPDGKVTV